MSSNESVIRELYADPSREDGRAAATQAGSMEFHFTAKLISRYVNRDSAVIELGCATGYYGMLLADKCGEYVGVDVSPESIDMFNRKIADRGLKNVTATVGNAVNLDGIEDSRFDVVLAFGPMYHLPPDERDRAFAECARICKDGGTVIAAYVSKAGVYVKGCLEFPDKYPDKQLTQYVLRDGMSDGKPGAFYFTMAEEIEARAKKYGLALDRHVGVDFVFNENIINAMDEERFAAWMDLADYMFERQSCAGLSAHALAVFRKTGAERG